MDGSHWHGTKKHNYNRRADLRVSPAVTKLTVTAGLKHHGCRDLLEDFVFII